MAGLPDAAAQVVGVDALGCTTPGGKQSLAPGRTTNE